MTGPDFDTISSGEQPQRLPRRSVPGFGGRGNRLTALSTAVTLVLAGGVATATYRAFQSSSGPAALVPSTAFAFGSVDLSLPGGQDSALGTFLGHFPGAPGTSGAGSTVDRLLRAAFQQSSDPHVDYDNDIKPWLGDHAAVAGWLDSSGKPRAEFLLQVTDAGKARTELGRLQSAGGGGGGFVITDGYAVLSGSTQRAQAAVDAAHHSALSDNSSFSSDIDRLPSGEAAVGWLDGPRLRQLLGSSLHGMGGLGLANPFLLGLAVGARAGGTASGQRVLNGRVVAGVRVADDYAQLDVATIGARRSPATRSTLLTDLPAGTIGAVELGHPGPAIDAMATLLRSMTSGMGMFGGASASSSCEVGTAIPLPALRLPPGVAHRRALLRKIRQARRDYRRSLRRQRHNAMPCQAFTPPRPRDPLAEFTRATGLTLPGDVKTLLGDGAVVSFGGIELGSLPDVAIRSQPANLDAAMAVANRLRQALLLQHGPAIVVDRAGSDLVLATSSSYAAEIAKQGALGAQTQAAKALGGIPDAVTAAGYVDFSRIWPLAEASGASLPSALQHLKALGFWGDANGDVQHLQLRVVVG